MLFNSEYMNGKIQKYKNIEWENLNSDGTIIGKIYNGIAFIRVWGYNLTINTAGNPYQILQLPDKYIPSRSVPFTLTRALANPETVS